MVGNVTIQGQIVGTATFDGAKISAVVTIAPPINATVIFGRSGVSAHNLLSDRDAEDVHPKESITGLGLTDSPEFANTQITTLQSDATGGIIPAAEATWLGATAKNVLSYLQKLVSEIFSIDGRVSAIEPKLIIDFIATSPVLGLDVNTFADGSPLILNDGDVVEVDTITYSTTVFTMPISLNNIKILGQYQSAYQTLGFNIVSAPFARCNAIINIKNQQCICVANTHRSNGLGNTTVTLNDRFVTRNVNDGGVITTPITSINIFGGTLNIGSRITIKKIR